MLQKKTKLQPLKLIKTTLEKPNANKKSIILLLMLAKIFLSGIRQFHFCLAVVPPLWKELCTIPMTMPSKCTTRAILNNRLPFTSKPWENAVFLAYVVNLYRAKLSIWLTNQLQLEKEQTQRSIMCTIFSKTMELVKQMFTSMQTTVAAKTNTIMSFGTGAGVSSTGYMRAWGILLWWQVTWNLVPTGALDSWSKGCEEHLYRLCLTSLKLTISLLYAALIVAS